MKSKTIVFIHGLNFNGDGWATWINYFTNEGYTCHAPSYPYHEGNAEERRKNIDERLKHLTFKDVYTYYAEFIDTLPEKPIIIGHSMGGLLTQKLAELGKAELGICICSAPPRGILCFEWSFFLCITVMTNFLLGSLPFTPGAEMVQFSICNHLSLAEAAVVREKMVVPESRNLPRSLLLPQGDIEYKKVLIPLHFITAENDRIAPVILNRRNAAAYDLAGNKKEIVLFEGRTHFICWQEDWQEVAGFCKDWIEKHI